MTADSHAVGNEAIADAVFTAINERRPFNVGGCWDSLDDLATELYRLATRGAHPDDRQRAVTCMERLAGLWLSTDEIERLYYEATGQTEYLEPEGQRSDSRT